MDKIFRASKPDLVTIANVEICSAGVAYELSTGSMTFTPEDLASAVTAANDDLAVKNPRLKLGHIDPRFNGPEYDASPAFGKATNMRLGNNGMSIYGDYVGVPRWLADIMPTAYPSRSIEGGKDVETVTGQKHDMVITAVSLLGVQWPGCSVIEDLPQYYGAEMPEGIQFVASATPIAASTNVDDIRRDFYKEWLPNQNGGSYWWIRAIYVDPQEVIYEDDDEGYLYRLPYTTSESEVTFGEPSQVEIAYNDVPQKVAASLIINGLVAVAGDKIAASYNSRGDSVLASEGGRMDPKEIRTRLGLPEDATDDQVNARLDQLRAIESNKVDGAAPFEGVSTGESDQTGGAIPQANDPSNTLGDGKTLSMEGHDPAKADELGIGNDAVVASAKAGTVVLDKAQYEQLMAGSNLAIKMHGEQIVAANAAVLDEAVRVGKIPPARREHYLNLLKVDPEGTKQILASLAPGLIPVDERGNGQTFEAGNGSDEQSAYPESWFPEVARQEPQAAGSRVTVEAK